MKTTKIELSDFEKQIAAQLKAGKPLTGKDSIFTPIMKRVLESMLAEEMAEHIASSGSPGVNRRNGKTAKNLKSSVGSFEIFSPRDRNGTFEPEVVKKRQVTLSDDIDQKILSMFSHSMSYEDIHSHVKDIYGIEVSDNLINQVTNRLLPDIQEWRSRPLEERYAAIWLDAIHYKIREDGVVTNKAVYCALGLDMEGNKDVLGFYISNSESSKFWLQVLFDIQARGVKDVLIFCTDNLKGFVDAIQTVYPQQNGSFALSTRSEIQ